MLVTTQPSVTQSFASDWQLRGIEGTGLEWQSEQSQLHCLGHVLNLGALAFVFAEDQETVDIAIECAPYSQQFLDEAIALRSRIQEQSWRKAPPLRKLYEFAIAPRNLQHHNEFKKLAKQLTEIPGDTRWNGWAMLIEEAFHTKPANAQLIDAHPELEELRLTGEDWTLLQDTYYFVRPFNEVTKLKEGAEPPGKRSGNSS
ncbi:hypothetical protein LTR17_024338 [Elasticomyces elasticus]|nr:hypothetical protein LTR17_024338 [Elasticomyces elasticus]